MVTSMPSVKGLSIWPYIMKDAYANTACVEGTQEVTWVLGRQVWLVPPLHPYPISNSCDQYLSGAHCGPVPTTGIRFRAIHTAWSLARGSRRTEDSRHGLRKVVTCDGKCMWQNYHLGWLQPSKKPSSKNGKYKRFWFQIFLLHKPINLSGGLFSSNEWQKQVLFTFETRILRGKRHKLWDLSLSRERAKTYNYTWKMMQTPLLLILSHGMMFIQRLRKH